MLLNEENSEEGRSMMHKCPLSLIKLSQKTQKNLRNFKSNLTLNEAEKNEQTKRVGKYPRLLQTSTS